MKSQRKREKPAAFWERAFAVCALLYGSTAFIRLLLSAEDYSAIGADNLASPTKRILWGITYAVAAYFLSKRYKSAPDVLRKMPLLMLLMAYIAISVLWSGSRMISILSFVALAGNSLIGIYFGIRYGIREFLRLLGWSYGIIAVSSFLSPILIRDYVIEGGYWNGFFAHKNALGASMTAGFLVFMVLARIEGKSRLLYRFFAVLCAGLVFLSGSATSIVILAALTFMMIGHFFMKKYIRRISSRAFVAVLILICATMLVFSNWSGILSALGKDTDFTGRVGIWGVLLSMARDKPLLGYGYGGFWILGGPAQDLWDRLGVSPEDAAYAHNGYLQLLVDGGIIGLALLLGTLFTTFRKAWDYFVVTKNTWPLYFVVFVLLHNLTEATFAVRNNVNWLLFVAVSVQLVRGFSREGTTVQMEMTFPSKTQISPASVENA
jgi:O-antigen ligase